MNPIDNICYTVFAVLVLSGCATVENPTAVTTDPETLALYANADKSILWKIDPDATKSKLILPRHSGCTTAGFLINSDGQPEEIVILKGYPNLGSLKRMAIKAIEGYRFIPTDKNPDRRPWRKTETFTKSSSTSRLGMGELRRICALEGSMESGCRQRFHESKVDATTDHQACLGLRGPGSPNYESCMRERGWSELREAPCSELNKKIVADLEACASREASNNGGNVDLAIATCLDSQSSETNE